MTTAVAVAWPVLGAAIAAQLVVLVMWPRAGVLDPADVDAGTVFSAPVLERIRGFRGPQANLAIAGDALRLATLGGLAWCARCRGLPARWEGAVGTMAAGLVVVVAPVVVALPVSAMAHRRAVDAGLVTRTWSGWAGDVALSTAISAVQTAVGFAILLVLIRRFPRRWWIPGAAMVGIAAALVVFVRPVLLDPLFNDFTPLRGPARAEVLTLADRAGVDVAQVYVVDASRRTTAANAYVGGLGASRRIVLFDTLRRGFGRRQQRLVVAHELGHARYQDLRRGLVYVLLVAPAGMLAVARIAGILAAAGRARRPGASAVPALAVAFALVVPVITTVSNQLSRRVEARADTFALALTDDPAAFVAFERSIAVRNLSDPDPPAWRQWWRGTHPTTVERIGVGRSWARGRRP